MYRSDQYIRFDWAAKRLLRNKANFGVLEGFLTVLIGEEIIIQEILESEGNQTNRDDKFNRVDIKAKNSKGEIIIVEIQNTREYYFLERILYGVAKVITEHMSLGKDYVDVKKVYSINILYFDIGKGTDYLYHGKNTFVGVNTGDELLVSMRKLDAIVQRPPSDVFPEYFLIRVNEFDKVAVSPLEEWIQYLKDGTISRDTKAPGLGLARETLQYYDMSEAERCAYEAYINDERIKAGEVAASKAEGRAEGLLEGRTEGLEEGLVKGLEEGRVEGLEEGMTKGREEGATKKQIEIAQNLKAASIPNEIICQTTGLSLEEVEKC